MNDRYWIKGNKTGPVFVLIGGEGEISPYEVALGNVVELAMHFNALVISIEHRYYGREFVISLVIYDNR
jgi:hypothetical protein